MSCQCGFLHQIKCSHFLLPLFLLQVVFFWFFFLSFFCFFFLFFQNDCIIWKILLHKRPGLNLVNMKCLRKADSGFRNHVKWKLNQATVILKRHQKKRIQSAFIFFSSIPIKYRYRLRHCFS